MNSNPLHVTSIVMIVVSISMQSQRQLQLAFSQPLAKDEIAHGITDETKLDEIETSEGLKELDKCGYTNGIEAAKVLECFEQNKEKIK